MSIERLDESHNKTNTMKEKIEKVMAVDDNTADQISFEMDYLQSMNVKTDTSEDILSGLM